MSKKSHAETKFGTIEGAAEYLGLLLESVDEARGDLEGETEFAADTGAGRRQEAIQLATYKLSQLKTHLTTSRRLLNDLRTIRRLLFAERHPAPGGAEESAAQFVTTAGSETPAPPRRPNGPVARQARPARQA